MGKPQQKSATKAEKVTEKNGAAPPAEMDVQDHLPPLGLVFTVIACSGFLFMFAFRDVFATGRTIAGPMDEAFLVRKKKIDLTLFVRIEN